ncbi:predicted protein [Cyanophage PSS2]|nr:predicted protein [Cyanophage PSS2]
MKELKKIVFATVAKDVRSEADKAHFEHLCTSKGLDPLAKEIWCVARGGKPTFMLSIDGFLKLANSTGMLDGIDIEFFDADGKGSEVWVSSKPPAACVARAYRKNCSRPFSASCRFDAYAQNSPLWKKLPEVMLSKVATTLALRRGFSDVLSGLHSPEEMDQAGMAPAEALAPSAPAAPAPVVNPPAEKPRKRMAPVEPVHEVIDRPTDDLHHGGVTEVQKNVAPKAVAVMEKPVEEGLPARDDLKGAISKLYEVARAKGLTVKGWESLGLQMGGLTPGSAAKFLTPMSSISEEKVGYLNSGKSTTGEALR